MEIKFTRIALELLNSAKTKEDIVFDERFVKYFQQYTLEERRGLYNELRTVIRNNNNDFSALVYTNRFSKDEINQYLNDFFRAFEANRLHE